MIFKETHSKLRFIQCYEQKARM